MVGCVIVPGLPTITLHLEVENAASWLVIIPSLGVILFGPWGGKLIDRTGAYKALFIGLFSYGLIGMAGFVIFLFVGGLLANKGWHWPFMLYLTAWALLTMALLFVPQPLRAPEQAMSRETSDRLSTTIKMVFLTAAPSMTVFFTAVVMLPLRLYDLGFDEAQVGYILPFTSLVAVAAAAIMPAVAGKAGERGALIGAFIFYALAHLLFVYADRLTLMVGGAVLLGAGFGLSIPLAIWSSTKVILSTVVVTWPTCPWRYSPGNSCRLLMTEQVNKTIPHTGWNCQAPWQCFENRVGGSCLFALQGVVTEGGTSFLEALASGDLFADLRFDVFNATCRLSDFHGTIARDDDDAIGVSDHDVAGTHPCLADRHRLVDSHDFHAVFAGTHEAAFAEQWVAFTQGFVHVAADTVDDGCGDTAGQGVLGHDIAPHRAIGTAFVGDDHNVAWRNVVDEVTDSTGRRARTDVLNGEGRADHDLAVVGQRGYPEGLAWQAQLIHGVGHARGIQAFEQDDEVFIGKAHIRAPP